MRLAFTLAFALTATSVFANDNLAEQLDIVAPLVSAGQLEQLGGPEDHDAIVEGIDGRWFTLQNTVRNWTDGGAADRELLTQTIDRTCSDTWENIVTHEVSGPGSFIVSQKSPTGEDQGTFDIVPVDGEARAFTTSVSDEYAIEMMNLENASAAEQEAALVQVRAALNVGVQIWRPSADLMVNFGAGEAEVWGRCPTS